MVSVVRIWLLPIAGVLLSQTAFAAGGNEGERKPSPPSLLVILQGYLANRDSFSFLSSHFTIMETKAVSVEAGLRGEYNAPQIVHHGFWYRNGLKERLRVSCNEVLLKKIREHEDSSIPIVLEDYLSDGKYRAFGGQAIGIVNFPQPGRPAKPRAVTPFNFYGGDFDQYLTRVLDNPQFGKVNGFTTWQGHELVSVSFSDPSVTQIYSVDPLQGYLPLIEEVKAGTMTVYKYIIKVKKVSDNSWFPEKWVSIQHLRGKKEEFRVRTLEVTSLDVSSPPPDSAFDFDLSEYFQVLDPDRASSVYHPNAGERIEVGKMQAVADKLDFQVADRSRPPPPGAEAAPRTITPFWRIVALGAPLILIGLVLILRYRHRNVGPGKETGATGS